MKWLFQHFRRQFKYYSWTFRWEYEWEKKLRAYQMSCGKKRNLKTKSCEVFQICPFEAFLNPFTVASIHRQLQCFVWGMMYFQPFVKRNSRYWFYHASSGVWDNSPWCYLLAKLICLENLKLNKIISSKLAEMINTV